MVMVISGLDLHHIIDTCFSNNIKPSLNIQFERHLITKVFLSILAELYPMKYAIKVTIIKPQ